MTFTTQQSTETKTHVVYSGLLTKEGIWPWELISDPDQKFYWKVLWQKYFWLYVAIYLNYKDMQKII